MNDDVIGLVIDAECLVRPVRGNFSWRVRHDVPICELKVCLIFLFSAAVDDAPALRRIDRKADRILFVVNDVNENAAAVEVRVTRVELRKGSGQIVGEDFVAEFEPGYIFDSAESTNLHAPRLIIKSRYR